MRTKKEILFLCQYFYPEYVSSATLPFDTARALVKAGFVVGALCGFPKEYSLKKETLLRDVQDGIEICRVKYLLTSRRTVVGRLVNYFSFALAVLMRFPSLGGYKAVIVYSNPPILPFVAALANRVFGIKVVFVSYDVYPEIAIKTKSISENGFISVMMRFINREVFRRATRVIAMSHEMKDYLLQHRAPRDAKQVVVIPNWYEDSDSLPPAIPHQNNMFACLSPHENFVVSYLGNMGVCQELETILGAIRQLKHDTSIKFLFAGHGCKLEQLRSTVSAEQLSNVFVYDFLHGQDFQDALSISGVFLVSLQEGLTGLAVPSKTYSYMKAGKPVIALLGAHTDIAKDLLKSQAGYVLNVGEVGKLVAAIREMKDDGSLRREMGLNIANLFRSKYTTEICTSQYIRVMTEVLGGN